MGFKATQSKPFCDEHWVSVRCPHRQLLTSCVIPSSVRSPRVSTSSSLWGHRELWGSTAGRGHGEGSQYLLLQQAQHHPTPGAVSPALHLPHPGHRLQGLDTGLPGTATLTPQHEASVCSCSSQGQGQGQLMGHMATHSPHRPPITPLPGPTPMYWSARQYERLWVLRAPCGRALG